ncbi:hypothetical protein ACLUTX_00680 [Enterobacterales bacterium AE_CKDN230030158-1A_HGKHYDSX7]
MMKAAYYCKQGRARDVLEVGEVSEPVPNVGEMRVRLVVSGLNSSDIKARTGFRRQCLARASVKALQSSACGNACGALRRCRPLP